MPIKKSIFILLCFVSCATQSVLAEEPSVLKSFTGKNIAELTSLSDENITIAGWITAGYTFNPLHPSDRSNGTVQFNNRANEFDLYQLGLYFEKPIDRTVKNWQVGGRFDFMFGTDAPNTQASGHWDSRLITVNTLRFYDVAFPQTYVEVFAPIGNGLSAKFGHFYSIIGYESVAAPLNLFVSHSYSMKSSPFTMTGALFSYPVDDLLNVQFGAVTGADNFDKHAGAWSFVGGFTLENQAHSRGFSFSILDGNVYDSFPSHLTYYYSMLHQDLTDKLHYVLQHDYGRQQNALANGQHAEWYSLVHYLTYDVNTEWSTGLRAEWFHDDDGTRFLTTPGSYYELSATTNWKPYNWLIFRPELRYDWAVGPTPFDEGTRHNQFLLSFDTVIRF